METVIKSTLSRLVSSGKDISPLSGGLQLQIAPVKAVSLADSQMEKIVSFIGSLLYTESWVFLRQDSC